MHHLGQLGPSWAKGNSWLNKPAKRIMIFVSYFIPTVNSNPRADTSCLGPTAPICNSVSGCLTRTGSETLGMTKKKRQEQIEHNREGCRSLAALPPPPAEGWNVADCGAAAVRREQWEASPGRTSVVGLEPHQTWFCFTPPNPAVLQSWWGGAWS